MGVKKREKKKKKMLVFCRQHDCSIVFWGSLGEKCESCVESCEKWEELTTPRDYTSSLKLEYLGH